MCWEDCSVGKEGGSQAYTTDKQTQNTLQDGVQRQQEEQEGGELLLMLRGRQQQEQEFDGVDEVRGE